MEASEQHPPHGGAVCSLIIRNIDRELQKDAVVQQLAKCIMGSDMKHVIYPVQCLELRRGAKPDSNVALVTLANIQALQDIAENLNQIEGGWVCERIPLQVFGKTSTELEPRVLSVFRSRCPGGLQGIVSECGVEMWNQDGTWHLKGSWHQLVETNYRLATACGMRATIRKPSSSMHPNSTSVNTDYVTYHVTGQQSGCAVAETRQPDAETKTPSCNTGDTVTGADKVCYDLLDEDYKYVRKYSAEYLKEFQKISALDREVVMEIMGNNEDKVNEVEQMLFQFLQKWDTEIAKDFIYIRLPKTSAEGILKHASQGNSTYEDILTTARLNQVKLCVPRNIFIEPLGLISRNLSDTEVDVEEQRSESFIIIDNHFTDNQTSTTDGELDREWPEEFNTNLCIIDDTDPGQEVSHSSALIQTLENLTLRDDLDTDRSDVTATATSIQSATNGNRRDELATHEYGNVEESSSCSPENVTLIGDVDTQPSEDVSQSSLPNQTSPNVNMLDASSAELSEIIVTTEAGLSLGPRRLSDEKDTELSEVTQNTKPNELPEKVSMTNALDNSEELKVVESSISISSPVNTGGIEKMDRHLVSVGEPDSEANVADRQSKCSDEASMRREVKVETPEEISAESNQSSNESWTDDIEQLHNVPPVEILHGLHLRSCNGVKVAIYKGDITKLAVDAVVNAANRYMVHGGGVARAIANAAGKSLVDECKEWIAITGPLPIGGVMVTGAGNMTCDYVMHAVGPRWTDHTEQECIRILLQTYTTCLRLADENHYKSIALPSIGAGTFGVPHRHVASCIATAIHGFCKDVRYESSSLKYIYVVDVIDSITTLIQKQFEDQKYRDVLTVVARAEPGKLRVKHKDGKALVGKHEKSENQPGNRHDNGRHGKPVETNESAAGVRLERKTTSDPTSPTNVVSTGLEHDSSTLHEATTRNATRDATRVATRDATRDDYTPSADGRNQVAEIKPVSVEESPHGSSEQDQVLGTGSPVEGAVAGHNSLPASPDECPGAMATPLSETALDALRPNFETRTTLDAFVCDYITTCKKLVLEELQKKFKVRLIFSSNALDFSIVTMIGDEKDNFKNASDFFQRFYSECCKNIGRDIIPLARADLSQDDVIQAAVMAQSEFPDMVIKAVNMAVEVYGPEHDLHKVKELVTTSLGIPAVNDKNTSGACQQRKHSSPKDLEKFLAYPCLTLKSTGNVQVKVYHGDITKVDVDVIVTSANGALKHVTGIGKALSTAAGPVLQKECDSYIKAHRAVDIGRVVKTGGGKLKCLSVLHAVSPKWSDYKDNEKKRCLTFLQIIFKKCLSLGSDDRSIALPAVGAGSSKIPKDLVSIALCEAVTSYCKKVSGESQLRTIHIIDMDHEIIDCIKRDFLRETWKGSYTVDDPIESISPETSGLPTSVSGPTNLPDKCPICLDRVNNPRVLSLCGHVFCEDCFRKSHKQKPVCPVCGKVYGVIRGSQPLGAKMATSIRYKPLPGEKCPTIVINYDVPPGKQTEEHPNPGKAYRGIKREAYLPDNREGKRVLSLLKKAFEARLIFTIGVSHTSGKEDQVTWNDIHHKTSMAGGAQNYGYPDHDYLRRVQQELADKNIR